MHITSIPKGLFPLLKYLTIKLTFYKKKSSDDPFFSYIKLIILNKGAAKKFHFEISLNLDFLSYPGGGVKYENS